MKMSGIEEVEFRPFTVESSRKDVENKENLQLNPNLRQGRKLPKRFRKDFHPEYADIPLEEIDLFYNNEKTFVVIGRSYDIFRFSATKALWIFSPFSAVRQVAIFILVHSWFSVFMNGIFLVNCFLMMVPTTPFIMSASVIFTALYTFEIGVKVIARGLILQPFTYLRNPWNWLDFIVTILAYVAVAVDITKLVPVASLRIFRLLKIATATSDLKVYTDIVIKSVIILKDMLIYAIFALTILAILFLRIYMGVLTRKCVKNFPMNDSWGNLTDEIWAKFVRNDSNWYHDDVTNEISLCGNSSDAQKCKPGYTCLEGYGENPNNGYTNFDSFGWSLLSIFRLVTRDYWENLYELLMASVGAWHVLLIIAVVLVVSLNLMNLIISIFTLSYGDLIEKVDDIEKREETVSREDDDRDDDLPINKEKEEAEEDDQERLDSVIEVHEEKPSYDKKIIFNPFVELFVVICIILNTVFLAMYHHNINKYLLKILTIGNYYFIITFGIEIVLKIVAASPRIYFKDNWNRFDFIVVAISMFGLVFNKFLVVSVLRSFVLLRLFRTPQCNSLDCLIYTMISSLRALTNLSVVMFIAIFIFAIMGMNLFGNSYTVNIDKFPKEELPRWTFIDFLHSFMLIFRIVCGEWIQSLWYCKSHLCIPFFLLAVFIGNIVVRNLFLVIVLNHYSCSPTRDDYCKRVWRISERLNSLTEWIKNKTKRKDAVADADVVTKSNTIGDSVQESLLLLHLNSIIIPELEVHNCLPELCYEKLPCLKGNGNGFWHIWFYLRYKTSLMIEKTYFEIIIAIIIISSSVALALEDIDLPNKPLLQRFLSYMDTIFTGIFLCEMLIMWFALGLVTYFKTGYCMLDFIVVVVQLINFGLKIETMKVVRVLRIVRLPFVLHFRQMRVFVDTITQAKRRIFLMLFLCLFMWLNFAVIGVHLFADRFYKCVDKNKTSNLEKIDTCNAKNYNRVNSPMNFDNIGNAYLSLVQVATFEGWLEIINDALESKTVDKQPMRESNIYVYFYFVLFIMIGSFFTWSMFIGVIFHKYHEEAFKANHSLEMFLMETPIPPQALTNAMKVLLPKQPEKMIPKPKCKPQAVIFEEVTSLRFEATMLFFVGLNLVILALKQHQQSETYAKILYYFIMSFALIFSTECLMKIFAFRWAFFTKFWNIFDLVVAILSIVELILSDLAHDYFLALPALVRVIRLIKIKKLLNSMKFTQNIPILFSTTFKSLTSLMFVFLLLFLAMFMYAVIGIFVFQDNFQTFGRSMRLLFQISTWSGWNIVLESLQNYNQALVISYLLSYLFVCFIIFTLYFSAICYNHKEILFLQDLGALTEDDFDNFYKIWQNFDPSATKYIRLDQLPDLLAALEAPFRFKKPNKFKIILLDIPIREGDLVLCRDVLACLTYDYFDYHEPILRFCSDIGYKKTISSTKYRQRENFCASVIQEGWQKYRGRVFNRSSNEVEKKDTVVVGENLRKVVLRHGKLCNFSKSVDI